MKIDIEKIEKEISKIKTELMEVEAMRPGSLTCQYKNPKEKTGASWQISYTHKMKSKTDYVKMACVDQIAEQIEEYKKFRELTDRWVELAIMHSNRIMKEVKRKPKNG